MDADESLPLHTYNSKQWEYLLESFHCKRERDGSFIPSRLTNSCFPLQSIARQCMLHTGYYYVRTFSWSSLQALSRPLYFAQMLAGFCTSIAKKTPISNTVSSFASYVLKLCLHFTGNWQSIWVATKRMRSKKECAKTRFRTVANIFEKRKIKVVQRTNCVISAMALKGDVKTFSV